MSQLQQVMEAEGPLDHRREEGKCNVPGGRGRWGGKGERSMERLWHAPER